MNETPTPAPSGVLERVAELEKLAALAEKWKPRSGNCAGDFPMPMRGACPECGAGPEGHCGRAWRTPAGTFARALQTDALPLIRDLASALAEARADAERYRFVRQDRTPRQLRELLAMVDENCLEHLDAAIDRALTPAGRGDE